MTPNPELGYQFEIAIFSILLEYHYDFFLCLELNALQDATNHFPEIHRYVLVLASI